MRQPWLRSARFDLAFIIGPAFLITALVLIFRTKLEAVTGTPPWMWLLLVVGVDVAHVYSTLFRSYFDGESFRRHRDLMLAIPALCWAIGAALYAVDALWFWRVLAYFAVYHFMRQQYGFMMLYGRAERNPGWMRRLDQAVIYLATLYPLLFWHSHARAFSWFVSGDFLTLPYPALATFAGWLYVVLLAAYLAKEAWLWSRSGHLNLPRLLLLGGTALSWWVGIVLLNNDLAFTATNVLAHGIPYLALIWAHGNHRRTLRPALPLLQRVFHPAALPVYLGILLLLAYGEEALWDGFVWREHAALFGDWLPAIQSSVVLILLVPLLALPQAVHYALDAFLWRRGTTDPVLRSLLFPARSPA